ncbi:MAG TPA: NUDIX domain-containing protein [Candidatus Sulfotelmatobacter sp.]
MIREISAGGVVLRKRGGVWWIAVIELPAAEIPTVPDSQVGGPEPGAQKTAPSKAVPVKATSKGRKPKTVLALPKGAVDAGERPLEAALREVREETGVKSSLVTKLADTKYVYVRTWGDGARVFKIVSFYLLRYESGRINDIAPGMRIEVARARWIRLEEAPTLLAYRGEKQMARRAMEYVAERAEL